MLYSNILLSLLCNIIIYKIRPMLLNTIQDPWMKMSNGLLWD